nr:TPA_asm: hypothetical protein HUJ06_005566 [Nelumbo nucifera]
MRPPSLHTSFFSSLKQVEKRLESESSSQVHGHCSSSTRIGTSCNSTDPLSSPIYLNHDQQPNSSSSSALHDSEPPPEFLSHSLDFPVTHEDPPPPNMEKQDQVIGEAEDNKDDIEQLIELLSLSDCTTENEDEEKDKQKQRTSDGFCFCHGGFYSKIAGVRGPKCVKEMERLDGWIKYFLSGGDGERKEPLRLVHLLLGKAACAGEDDSGFGVFEFPPTIEEFLQYDPPMT